MTRLVGWMTRCGIAEEMHGGLGGQWWGTELLGGIAEEMHLGLRAVVGDGVVGDQSQEEREVLLA